MKKTRLIITCIVLVALITIFCIIGFNGEWVKPLVEGAGWYGYILFVLIQVIVTTLLCFVPATTFTFALLATQLFGVWQGVLVASLACFLSSMTMFTIGDKLGEPFVDWLVGRDSRIKAQNLVSTRATVLVPFMLAFPFFPDDAICMVSGMTKMKYWYFAIVALVCRTIGIVATCVLGGDIIPYHTFGAFEWIVFINLVLIDVLLIWRLSTFVEKCVNNRKQKKEDVNDECSDK